MGRITLYVPTRSLVWLQNFKEPEGQLARWLEKLQEYDFIIKHRKGTKHGNADALSRLPCTQCGRGDSCGKELSPQVAMVDVVLYSGWHLYVLAIGVRIILNASYYRVSTKERNAFERE